MTPPLDWHDWIADGVYRVRVAPSALSKLRALPDATQDRLKRMLMDIASIADSQPPSASGRGWRDAHDHLLHLSLGRVSIRYSIDEQSRTLTVEHVIVLGRNDELGQTG